MRVILIVFILGLSSQFVFSQKQVNYKTPPKEIVDLVNAPNTPGISVDPTRNWILQLGKPDFSSIETLSQKELRIGGIRINPLNFSQSRAYYYDSLVLLNISNGKEFPVQDLPPVQKFKNFTWSPNGKYVAFTNSTSVGVELWLLDIAKKNVEKLSNIYINNTLPINPICWIDHGEWLVFTSIPESIGLAPVRDKIPQGPVVRESRGKKAIVRTYQDLLKDKHDIKLFEHYTTSQLIKINIKKESYPIGAPASYKQISASPDSRYLLVKMIKKPYSYIVPYYRFPYKVEVWDTEGIIFRELFKIPASENIPKGFDAVRKGPRQIGWRSDKPASLFWVYAMDGGDPNKKSIIRDRLFMFDAPFDGEGYESIAFEYRFDGIDWGKDNFAIAYESWWTTRTKKVSTFDPSKPEVKKTKLFEFDWQDEYKHPGYFMTSKNESGYDILLFANKDSELFLKGKGATPDGYRPFIDKFTIAGTYSTERIWQSIDPYYENPIYDIDIEKGIILTRRESKSDPPNLFSRNLKNGVVSQITNYLDPYPQLKTAKFELLKYKREDGTLLTGKLYLPPGYSLGDGLLPVILWAYPNEYKSAVAASQVKDSPNKFVRIGWWSPLFWLMRGYAIFDNPAMPIIGEGKQDPNDTFVEQLVENAKAAINCLDSVAIVDKNRIAIGGHSYGAFMVANLLAHSDLFAAGIARSGAYNRTLTPFGFQSEERTFWEAKDTYIGMSPFSFAHKINKPILLIHGDSDNNSGTYPLQSERMFSALKGNGQIARLVMLPNESHGYKAKESIMHMLWEMDNWLEKYVKNKGAE